MKLAPLARLQSCRRELVGPAIAEFRGRIIKLMGDGALVEFILQLPLPTWGGYSVCLTGYPQRLG